MDRGNVLCIVMGAVFAIAIMFIEYELLNVDKSGIAKCDTDTDCMEKFGGNGDPE